MRKSKKNPVGLDVKVVWLDPCGFGGWIEPAQAIQLEPAICESRGVCLAYDDNRIVVAGSKNNAGLVGDVTSIPTVLVKEVKVWVS